MSCYVLHLVFQYGIGGTFDFNTTFVLPRTYKKTRAVQGNEREGCDYNDRPWNLSWHSRTREETFRRGRSVGSWKIEILKGLPPLEITTL